MHFKITFIAQLENGILQSLMLIKSIGDYIKWTKVLCCQIMVKFPRFSQKRNARNNSQRKLPANICFIIPPSGREIIIWNHDLYFSIIVFIMAMAGQLISVYLRLIWKPILINFTFIPIPGILIYYLIRLKSKLGIHHLKSPLIKHFFRTHFSQLKM